MCGIYCSISHCSFTAPNAVTEDKLRKRGPDRYRQHDLQIGVNNTAVFISCFSSVLSLRGREIVEQPLIDSSTSFLCWNGEAWKIGSVRVAGNDASAVFDLFLKAAAQSHTERDLHHLISAICSVQGPYAFIFYDSRNKRIYFGRDVLGRRSLLRGTNEDGTLIIASFCCCSANESQETWQEVEADGIYYVTLDQAASSDTTTSEFRISQIPTNYHEESSDLERSSILPYRPLNRSASPPQNWKLGIHANSLSHLQTLLQESLHIRIHELSYGKNVDVIRATKLAILFSGGLDCTLLARILHDIFPESEDIDLLNVAFYNPRINRGATNDDTTATLAYEACPDRITGRKSLLELKRVCPSRNWRFVSINIPYEETTAHRETVLSLMYPHRTEMDVSIAYALYFASRGSGIVEDGSGLKTSYTTPARVLLSGLGADEIFAGYQRHATAFTRRGYAGLVDELAIDISRLGKRNLGRDDRVISHWSREVRFPYLDEDFFSWALSIPVWEKCGFGESDGLDPMHDTPVLEPGKKLLRLLAWKLGMKQVAMEKKRAIQFGARTAKMESGNTKGTQLLS